MESGKEICQFLQLFVKKAENMRQNLDQGSFWLAVMSARCALRVEIAMLGSNGLDKDFLR